MEIVYIGIAAVIGLIIAGMYKKREAKAPAVKSTADLESMTEEELHAYYQYVSTHREALSDEQFQRLVAILKSTQQLKDK